MIEQPEVMKIEDVYNDIDALRYKAENGFFIVNWGTIAPISTEFIIRYAKKWRHLANKSETERSFTYAHESYPNPPLGKYDDGLKAYCNGWSWASVLVSYLNSQHASLSEFSEWQKQEATKRVRDAYHHCDDKYHYIVKRLYTKDVTGYTTYNSSDSYVKLRTEREAHEFARSYSKQHSAHGDRVGVFKLVGHYKAENPKPVEPVIVYCAVEQEE